MADFLYGDGAPPWSRAARQARFDTWCCVCLAVSFLVRFGSSSEKGGLPSSPPPPLLAPTLGWPPRDGSVSAPQLPTPGWPLEERRETSPRQFFCVFVLLCFDFFFYLFFFYFFIYLFIYLFIFFYLFIYLFIYFYFFFWGGGVFL